MVDLHSRPATTPFGERVARVTVRVMENVNIPLFRLSHGRVGGSIFGEPVILLTTTGRVTGARHTKPLLALADGDDAWIVAASRGGTRANPDWYENLVAFTQRPDLAPPVVEAEGRARTPVAVQVLEGDDRAGWWERLVDVYPRFASYQERSQHREIPVVRLSFTTH